MARKTAPRNPNPHRPPPAPSPDVATFPAGSLISLPRADGAVQHRDWNAFLASEPNVPKWANRWMFLQDTVLQFLSILTQAQLLNNQFNFGNARMIVGTMWTQQQQSMLGVTWLPFDESNGDKNRTAILDAVTFCADFQAPGREFSAGTWAKDIAALIPQWKAKGYWLNQNPPYTPFPVGP